MLRAAQVVLEQASNDLHNVWARVGLSDQEREEVGERWVQDKLQPLLETLVKVQCTKAGKLSSQNVATLDNIHDLGDRLQRDLSNFHAAFPDSQFVREMSDKDLLAPLPHGGGSSTHPSGSKHLEDLRSIARILESEEEHLSRLAKERLGVLQMLVDRRTFKPFEDEDSHLMCGSSRASHTSTGSGRQSTVGSRGSTVSRRSATREVHGPGDVAVLGFKQDLSVSRILEEAEETIAQLGEMKTKSQAQITRRQNGISDLWEELQVSREEKEEVQQRTKEIQRELDAGFVPDTSGPRSSQRRSTTSEVAQETLRRSSDALLGDLPPIVQQALSCPSPEPLHQYLGAVRAQLLDRLRKNIDHEMSSTLLQLQEQNQKLVTMTGDRKYENSTDYDVFLLMDPVPVTLQDQVDRRKTTLAAMQDDSAAAGKILVRLAELFPLLKRRKEILDQRETLEKSSCSAVLTDRRVNMAKVLLEQEKARKVLKQELPRIEGRVRALCGQWASETSNVLIQGQTLEDILESMPEEIVQPTRTQLAMRGTTGGHVDPNATRGRSTRVGTTPLPRQRSASAKLSPVPIGRGLSKSPAPKTRVGGVSPLPRRFN